MLKGRLRIVCGEIFAINCVAFLRICAWQSSTESSLRDSAESCVGIVPFSSLRDKP